MNKLGLLAKSVEYQMQTRTSTADAAFLKTVALLWRRFATAKGHGPSRFAAETVYAEYTLREVRRRGFLTMCLERGLLPQTTDTSTMEPHRGRVTPVMVKDEPLTGRARMRLAEERKRGQFFISGGAVETNRRKH